MYARRSHYNLYFLNNNKVRKRSMKVVDERDRGSLDFTRERDNRK